MEDVFGVGFLVLMLLALAYVSSAESREQQREADQVRDNFRTHCEKVVGGYAVQDLAGKYRCAMNAE